jgi:hypothetical protein
MAASAGVPAEAATPQTTRQAAKRARRVCARDCRSSHAFGLVWSHPVESRWRLASGPVSTDRQPPPAAVEDAKWQPNGWVYEIVGGEQPDGSVPPERIRGAWQVNAAGEIVGQFTPNPRFVEPAE